MSSADLFQASYQIMSVIIPKEFGAQLLYISSYSDRKGLVKVIERMNVISHKRTPGVAVLRKQGHQFEGSKGPPPLTRTHSLWGACEINTCCTVRGLAGLLLYSPSCKMWNSTSCSNPNLLHACRLCELLGGSGCVTPLPPRWHCVIARYCMPI